jgi:hypothetical protein
MKYSSSFYYDLELGEQSETWLKELFADGRKIEVKTDLMADKTKNIYIEIYSRGKKSGLSTTQAEYWIIKTQNVAIIISTKTLKEIVRHCFSINGFKKGGDNDTSLGVLVPINLLFNENISNNI